MPKDATKNVDRYKVRGGDINEFEFHQNQEQFLATKGTKATKQAKKGAAAKKGSTTKKAGRKSAKK